MTTVVLVHSAWHGSRCWERVNGMLSARGVRSIALNLPSHGDDPRPLTDLYGDAEKVEATLDSVESVRG